MKDQGRRNLLAGASIIGAAALVRAARGGPLTPPAGAVTSTGRTLKEVEPRTPVQSLTGTVDYAFVISQPGSYYLTGDIVLTPNLRGILVTASPGGVTIDMEGFTIRGGAGGITCATPGPDYLEVCDGFIRDMSGAGIDSGGARVVDCYDLHVDRCGDGIVVRGSGFVEACHVERCLTDGLILLKTATVATCFAVDECEFRACGRHGIGIIGDWTAGDTTVCISDCDCIGNAQDGIHLGASAGGNAASLSMSVMDCRCSSNGGFGSRMSNIGAAGSLGARCTLQIEDCICSRNTLGGMRVFACFADLMDCTCCDNGGDGFMLDMMGGSVDGCTASRNTSAGVRLMGACRCSVCDCACHSNTAEGLTMDAACIGLSITECDCQNNAKGIRVVNPSNFLLWNTASGNGMNYDLDPAMPVVVVALAALPGNMSPHANYAG